MVRKGLWCGLSFVLGLFAANAFSVSLWWIIALSVVSVCAVFAFVSEKLRTYLIVCGLTFAAACVYCAGYTYFISDEIRSFSGKTVTIDGYVYDYNYIGHGQGYLTVKGKLSGHTTKISFLVSDDDYEYYDEVIVTGKVTGIKDSYNFLAESYYSTDGVFLKGDGAASVKTKGTNADPLFRTIRKYSDKIFSVIRQYGGYNESGFLGAMLCGDKSDMDPAVKNMLYRSGIGHIFAVSGTHLVILTAVFGFIIGLFIKSKRIKTVILLIITWAFVIFAGMSVSVIRSAILLTVVYAGDIFVREGDCANSLGIAGIILGLVNPYCVHSPGFILSFTSAFAAGAAAPYICKRLNLKDKKHLPIKAFVSSCTVCVFISPVCLVYFGGFSVLAPILNILLIPFCTCALVLCFLVAVTGGMALIAKPLLFAASQILKLVFAVVRFFSNLTLLYVSGGNYLGTVVLILVCVLAIIYVCLCKKTFLAMVTALGWALICLLCSNIFILINSDRYEMYVFADKKSCTVAVVRSDRAMLFDLNSSGEYISACERVISKNGVRYVDAVFINSEINYTAGRYKDGIYPYYKNCYSAVPLAIDIPGVSMIETNDTKQFEGVNVKRIDGGFEINFGSNSYKLYPDCFYVNSNKYNTNGVCVYYNAEDDNVRRLDYELGITDYTW